MKLNITQLSELTGVPRKTVASRLAIFKNADGEGINGQRLFCSIKAIPAIKRGVDPETGRQNLTPLVKEQIKSAVLRSHLVGLTEKLASVGDPRKIKALVSKSIAEAVEEADNLFE